MLEEQYVSMTVVNLASQVLRLQVIVYHAFVTFELSKYTFTLPFGMNGIVDNTCGIEGGGALSLDDHNALNIHESSFTSNGISCFVGVCFPLFVRYLHNND